MGGARRGRHLLQPDHEQCLHHSSLNPRSGSNFTYNASRANPVITLSDLTPLAALGTASPTPDILTIGPEFPTGTINQWSLSVERTLWPSAVLDLQYSGSRSFHLDTSWQRDAPARAPGQSRRAVPTLSGAGSAISNNAVASYNGMNVILTQRMRKGLSLNLNYTWAHNLDMSDFSTGGGNITYPDDWWADYGNSSWDIRHRFAGSYTWQLPFFQEASTNAFLARVLGGWSIAGIVTMESGTPVNVTSGRDIANTGAASQRPDLVGRIDASRCGEILVACINADAFAMPAAFTYGNAGRDLFHGPRASSSTRRSRRTSPSRSIVAGPGRHLQHAQPPQLRQPQRKFQFDHIWQHHHGQADAADGVRDPIQVLTTEFTCVGAAGRAFSTQAGSKTPPCIDTNEAPVFRRLSTARRR